MAKHTLKIMGRDVEIDVREPEHAASDEFRQQVQEGWGDDQALEDARLAAEVRAMGMDAYSRFRHERGIGSQSVIDFLGGTR